ncbi:hypothetical protein D9M70_494710 [compost metagenome]
MTTLAEERAAIRDGISAARESTSNRVNTAESGRKASREAIKNGRASTSQDDRRALGESLERQRRGTTLRQDLNALETPKRGNQVLSTRQATGGRPENRGRGTWDPATPAAGGGGGIASPLTETAYADRTRWAEVTLSSSDGLLSFRIAPVKDVIQKDANDLEVKQVFANPSPPPP